MPVLFVSSNFPPEVNALATRTWEHAREWVRMGGAVEVLAGPPHFPEGRIYEGYENRFSKERCEGVDVMRVPMYVHANEGFLRRTLSYVSYMVSAVIHSSRTCRNPAVVIASSPQIFAALAGLLISKRKRIPFVLEIRDLWPESIVDVGVMRRGILIAALERIEIFLYQSADHIVIVSPAFRSHIEGRGVLADRISVLPNGVDNDWFAESVPGQEIAELRDRLDLEGKFVASYIGTVGMAHGVRVVLEAARLSSDPSIVFMIVGAGAEWQSLRAEADTLNLPNLLVIEKQPRELIRLFYALSDVSIVHLRDRPAFRKVLPSKMFESMAMGKPVVSGVLGESQRILDLADSGITIQPEDPEQLLAAVHRLRDNPDLCLTMGENGRSFVMQHYDRNAIARQYWSVLEIVSDRV